jgi:hypothetical protein
LHLTYETVSSKSPTLELVFTPWIQSLLEAAEPRVIVEVGAAEGTSTVQLLKFADARDCIVHSIDPRPEFDVEGLKRQYGDRFVFHRAMSLEALDRIDRIEAILIDGDHNWYTVYNELKLLERKAAGEKSRFPLAFIHDMDWPFGRRDLYYNPDSIPEEYRQPFRKGGIVPGQAELSDTEGGYVSFNAVLENTPRNGVRTAVEDFLSETDLKLRFHRVIGSHGIGILVPEEQLEENLELRQRFEELDSPEWLRDQCERIEAGRARLTVVLAETQRKLAEREQRLAEVEGELAAARGGLERNKV